MWPSPGKWTYADYCKLPDDGRRYEVIRGFLYVSPAPSLPHQRALGRLFVKLHLFVLAGGLGEVLFAPVDVLLPREIAAPVQPDLMFFRTGNQPGAEAMNFKGVPDLVVEILSPSTRRLDKVLKLDAYERCGVQTYWIFDRVRKGVQPYERTDDRLRPWPFLSAAQEDILTSPLLPGFELALADLFEE